MSDWQYAQSNDSASSFEQSQEDKVSRSESTLNLEKLYKNNTKYATQSVLPPDDYHSPYYIPFKNVDDPRPVNQLVYRFSIWKMIIKQIVFYFKEMSVFKQQTYQGNRAMLENLEILRKQNSGKLKSKTEKHKVSKSISSASIKDLEHQASDELFEKQRENSVDCLDNDLINKLLQTTFLPSGDSSILSIPSTFFNTHNYLKERELITYQQLTNRLIPRLENLRDQLNETIKQMNSIKNSSDYKTKNLKMEIAKTGGILSDYITSIELLRTGNSKSSLGTTLSLNEESTDSKMDPYILKLKLDLQLKDQLYIEAHLKEMYYDLQYKAVQLEKILYSEIQSCISTYTDLIDNELNSVKDNLILTFKQGFIINEPTIDWDYFIRNDQKRNFLPIDAQRTLSKQKIIRKNSDIIYPYRNNVISSCIFSGYLDRKSKYLKNYSKFYYVLTINFLHEFKSSERIKDLHPLQSFPLSCVSVSAVDTDPRKFVIRVNKPSSKTKFTFKSESAETTLQWVDYLSDLADFDSTIERNVSYDMSDEDMEENDHQPHPPIEDSFFNNQYGYSNAITSPLHTPDSNSMLSHSRSISDDYFKSQHHQVQQSLSQQQQTQQSQAQQMLKASQAYSQSQLKSSPQDDMFNLSNIAFKSVKSQPSMMTMQRNNSSTSLNSQPSSRAQSRSSSRTSSRASSPVTRLRATATASSTVRQSALMSPKIAPSTPASIPPLSATSTSSTGDYFSYAPRKVQASIIRNGNRLASSSSTSRLTPGSMTNLQAVGHTSPPVRASTTSLSMLSTNNVSTPKINITESTPIATEKPDIGMPFRGDANTTINGSDSYDESSADSGLERRRKTLFEQLDMSGLNNQTANINLNSSNINQSFSSSSSSSMSLNHLKNKMSANAAFLKMPSNTVLPHTAGLPQTPGIIPGSKMNAVFETNYDPLGDEAGGGVYSEQYEGYI